MRMVLAAAIAAVWIAGGCAAPSGTTGVAAPGAMVSARDPDSVLTALRDLGYRATAETAPDGDPRITMGVEGVVAYVDFYGCVDNAACRHLLFTAAFETEEPRDLALMNDWNRNFLVGPAFLDEDADPTLDYFVAAEGGMPMETFAAVVDMWASALADFMDHIDF